MLRFVTTIGFIGTLLVSFWTQREVIVCSINPLPGDWFTHSGSRYAFRAFFQPPGWYYGHVQNNGIVGINTTFPRSGNGSVYFETPTSAAKSDIEYRHDLVNQGMPLGRLADLEWLSYEHYRSSQSTVGSHIHMPIRIYVANIVNGNITDLGYLIYERSHNFGSQPIPNDVWLEDEIVASNRRVWQNPINGGNFFDAQPFSVWQSEEGYQPREGSRVGVRWNGDSVVVGISLGAGTGWNGRFVGAIDNVKIRFRNGVEYHFNFEARVPGDVTGDGFVDDEDLLVILMWFDNTCAGCSYDINGDTMIDVADLLIVLANFGRSHSG